MSDRLNHDAFSTMKGYKRITIQEWDKVLSQLSHFEARLQVLERKMTDDQSKSAKMREKPF